MELLAANFSLLPFVIGSAWCLFFWKDRHVTPLWRRWLVVAGLTCSTGNLLMFLSLAYMFPVVNLTGNERELYSLLSTTGAWLALIVLGCALGGKGLSRAPLALASPMGFLLWVVPGIL